MRSVTYGRMLPPIFGVSLFFCSMILCRPAVAYGDKSGVPPVPPTRHIPLYAPRLPPGTPNFSSVILCRGVIRNFPSRFRLTGNKYSFL